MTDIDNLQASSPAERKNATVQSASIVPAEAGRTNAVRAGVVDELRRLLPRMSEATGEMRVISFGIPELDFQLHRRGLAFGALHEVTPAADEDAPAALGFIMALLGRASLSDRASADAMLFVMPTRWHARYGQPYGHGLRCVGLDPSRVIFTQTADDKQSLWAIEEALRSSALTAVAGVLDTLDLKTSQRLQFSARETGLPLLILRPSRTLEASAATTRWRVGAAEAARDRFDLVTHWRWKLRLERCRNGRGGEWLVEFDHVAHRFGLVAALAGSAVLGSPIPQSSRRTG